jgi:NAD(P)-dependent dehydrogenase (short-subunit alcohol dehydrogenase family)
MLIECGCERRVDAARLPWLRARRRDSTGDSGAAHAGERRARRATDVDTTRLAEKPCRAWTTGIVAIPMDVADESSVQQAFATAAHMRQARHPGEQRQSSVCPTVNGPSRPCRSLAADAGREPDGRVPRRPQRDPANESRTLGSHRQSFVARRPHAQCWPLELWRVRVSSFSRVLAGEVGPRRIAVNCVAPSRVPTAMTLALAVGTGAFRAQRLGNGVGRLGTP